MTAPFLKILDKDIRVLVANTLIVGSGAASFSAAAHLLKQGHKKVTMITENINAGTSRNTGSDKQTYYKLSLCGNDPDSIGEMAQTLFDGQCVDGDIALCEAASSARCFYDLVDLGVPFPRNRYGEYVGYKTDHDPRSRATSVGPYTSKMMTEKLQAAAVGLGLQIYDKMQAVRILTEEGQVRGVLCLDTADTSKVNFIVFKCMNIIWATGGPAGIYSNSVYPHGHHGSNGIAFEAGAKGKNLTEWQYGLASIMPRWNVSGTYMQCLPKFVSTDESGGDRKEFLLDYFDDIYEMMNLVFLKGYQWPFDVHKILGESSLIDILVDIEAQKGRRIFLDYRDNPAGLEIDFDQLYDECRIYLSKANACFGTPFERLSHMNRPAVDFYLDKGVDLRKEPLEIALCAQHNNGGIEVDCWWQTNINGLFAVGEAAATHGVYRPGGSALNAGQVGALRAAQYISARCDGMPDWEFSDKQLDQIAEMLNLAACVQNDKMEENIQQLIEQTETEMSKFGAAFRNFAQMKDLLRVLHEEYDNISQRAIVRGPHNMRKVFLYRDILISQIIYLEAMIDYVQHGGKSRGSALYSDALGQVPRPGLPDRYRFNLDHGDLKERVQITQLQSDICNCLWREIRPIPQEDNFFENVWRGYRENKNLY